MTTWALTLSDTGWTISARRGDEVVLRLPESPTTGYRWHVDQVEEHLTLEADSYEPDAPMRMGSGGIRELRYRAESAGRTRLALKHWQAWEGEGSVTERFTVEIDVSE